MPLMAKLPSGMADHEKPTVQMLEDADIELLQTKEREEKDSGYEDFDAFEEEPEDSDMEGSIVHRPRPRKAVKPPAVPARSDKRASRILENVMLELQSMDGSIAAKEEERQSVSDPHELYLSSEEDASLSDDYEYYDNDSLDLEEGDADTDSKRSSRASTRGEMRDTARIVSFTLITKPQIIQIVIQSKQQATIQPRTSSMSTSYIPPSSAKRPAPLTLYSSVNRPLSAADSLTNHSNSSVTSLLVRKSSKLNLSTIVGNAKNSFLSSDPYASPSPSNSHYDEEDETPKTPTSLATAAWKKRISRTISKARTPSMSKLSHAYSQGASATPDGNRENLKESVFEEKEELEHERAQVKRSQTMPVSQSDKEAAERSHRDILKNAIWVPPSPARERKMGMGIGRMGLGRKKSVKGKGARYVG